MKMTFVRPIFTGWIADCQNCAGDPAATIESASDLITDKKPLPEKLRMSGACVDRKKLFRFFNHGRPGTSAHLMPRFSMRFLLSFLMFALTTQVSLAQDERRVVMVVFDMSGSMWG
ncbi:hypothetical protein OS189_09095 [Sulfitobacter sp. F26169L]|uniref:hypothetical protein n=1 Tax=Sulfitobacter sp. F26169L TaxID=2996015 RepID=UPI002260B3EF|nr:hypothetical protein [Sulfitobacter sp. F26169L]MCX7566494.1 hypothetical protein [Sulfitobacter sp. F26169L]